MKKHAYLIMAHNNFDQLAMLCRLLNDERNDLYVMIDSKVINPPPSITYLAMAPPQSFILQTVLMFSGAATAK